MNETVIARRYARALVECAAEQNELESAREELIRLADILDPARGDVSVPELLEFLCSPMVTIEHKVQLTDVVCEKLQIGKLVSDFLNVLIKRHRVTLCGIITREYIILASKVEKISPAEVESAQELTELDEERLREVLEKLCGDKVRLHSRVNKSLIGGVRVKMGDMLYDGSLKGRLERMAGRLA